MLNLRPGADFRALAQQLPSELLEIFQRSLQVGTWPDGRVLTARQRQICTEALRLRGYSVAAQPRDFLSSDFIETPETDPRLRAATKPSRLN
ncbi:MAG: DUF1315 family protein [Pseudomonadota bacterium]